MSVRPNVRMNNSVPTERISIKYYMSIFRKYILKKSSSIKIEQEWGVLYTDTNTHLWSYLASSCQIQKRFRQKL